MECSEFIDLVVRLDHRLSERKGDKFWGDTCLVVLKTEKKESSIPTHEPMQIGSVRGPLSKEEKERRKKIETLFILWHSCYQDKPLLVTPLHCGSTHSAAIKPDDTLAIPAPYKDFRDVSSEQKATELPPHRSCDCRLDLIPVAAPPCSRVYALSEPENQYLRDYLDDLLAKGFIRHSASPVSSSFFFVPKKNRKLRASIDYRTVNKICIHFC
ncbi:hypothetical protein NDU88_002997 [Pleurodeles waltl]|uniref:Uncharacterized protein n=1 Tax=Pleurodeles waltl TaxID=8319 RepID=A0AAV7VC61_PLEWA|nr:hypothetical protein NDU88_002997 [Pleurodeles waltl]